MGQLKKRQNSNKEQRPVKSGNADDAAFNEKRFISYYCTWVWNGVAQAQHALREMVDTKKNDIKVSYAIHPVVKNAMTYECIVS